MLPHLRSGFFVLTLISAASLSAAQRMTPGNWEFRMTTDGASHSTAHCISEAEARSVNGDTRSARAYAENKSKGRCQIKAYEVSGDTITYTLQCGPRMIQSKTIYHGDTSKGVLKTTFQSKETVTEVSARRLGDCK